MSHRNTIIAFIVVALGITLIWIFLGTKNQAVVPIIPSQAFDVVGNSSIDKYNTVLSTTYITTPHSWPPVVSISSDEFVCVDSGDEILENGKTTKTNIAGREYCVTVQSQGAAGSTYNTYTYKTILDQNLATLSFVLRFPECLNYDDPKQAECLLERNTFDADGLANAIIENSK